MVRCADGSCCCFSTRSATGLIALLGFGAGLFDMWLNLPPGCTKPCCLLADQVDSFRKTLVASFQIGNVCLLAATLFENPSLIQLYLWCTLSFVILGLLICIADLLYRSKHRGLRSLYVFVPQVAFLFVLFRCLLMVDLYRRYLDGETSIELENKFIF